MDEEQVKKKVREQFAKNADKYVTSESHAKGMDLPLLIHWLNPDPKWEALDIATGGGHVAKTLSPHVAKVVATDLTREMLTNTAQHLKPTCSNMVFVVADAENLPFLDASFDVVTCRIAPHHFPRPQKFIEEIQRVLKTDGLFLMIDNVAPEEPQQSHFLNTMELLRDESHVHCLSIQQWEKLMQSAGLTEVKSHHRKKTHHYPTWVERTANSQDQIQRVSEYILAAKKEIQDYFSVKKDAEGIQSIEVDEWMVLCKKR